MTVKVNNHLKILYNMTFFDIHKLIINAIKKQTIKKHIHSKCKKNMTFYFMVTPHYIFRVIEMFYKLYFFLNCMIPTCIQRAHFLELG